MPARRNRKNGRFSTQTRRRRTRKTTNLSQVAQQYLIADAISRGLFNTNLLTFVGLRKDFAHGFTVGNNSNELTAMEIFDRLMGGRGGMGGAWDEGGLPKVLKSNFKANGGMMLASVIGIPIAFKVGTKLLRKPILTPANRMLKAAGMTGVKV